MFDFVQSTLVAINLVLMLALPVLLVLLCIRTRSKGLILITAVLICRSTIGLIPDFVMKPFLDQWSNGELNNWLTQHMTVGQFIVLYHYVSILPYNGLLILGVFLIYREWSHEKIRWNQINPQK
ncbi:hypothetical protein C6502_12200 [Candidatus Poribacteria bacterium]|nr:MAG: hypothetical protein C6502_12200 [Candidatus Poribacteria bacterium]